MSCTHKNFTVDETGVESDKFTVLLSCNECGQGKEVFFEFHGTYSDMSEYINVETYDIRVEQVAKLPDIKKGIQYNEM